MLPGGATGSMSHMGMGLGGLAKGLSRFSRLAGDAQSSRLAGDAQSSILAGDDVGKGGGNEEEEGEGCEGLHDCVGGVIYGGRSWGICLSNEIENAPVDDTMLWCASSKEICLLCASQEIPRDISTFYIHDIHCTSQG